MRIFIIHSLKLLTEALEHEKKLGISCYIPGRDTEQTGGDNILPQNLKGMKGCQEVHVIWDGQSQGTLFDMGMAYALGLPIKPVKLFDNRSWQNYFKTKIGNII